MAACPSACRLLRRAAVAAPSWSWRPQVERGLVTATTPKKIKRFWNAASAEPVEGSSSWQVLLDSKPVRTPKGTLLELPSRAVAESVAGEWAAAGENLNPKEMPLTTIGCTTVDLIRPEVAACVERMIPYLVMDTVCFEDDHEPMAELQQAEWGPLRRWFEERFDVTLGVVRGFGAPEHPEATLAAVEADLRTRDAWELCALEIAISTAKSLVVGTALLDRSDVTAAQALRWALLEEHFQIERWGLVEGEHDVGHSEILMWLEATKRFSKNRRGEAVE